MGCGGSKQAVADGSNIVSHRRLRRTTGSGNSRVETSPSPQGVNDEAAPPAIVAASAAAAGPHVKDITVNVDWTTAAAAEDERSGESARGVSRSSDAPAAPLKAEGNEKGGVGGAEEQALLGNVRKLEGKKMMRDIAPSRPCNFHDAPKPDGCGRGEGEEEDSFPPKADAQVETLKRQLQQLAEQLARFQVCKPEAHENDSRASVEDVMGIRETRGEVIFDGLRVEEDPKFAIDSVFGDEQFSDAHAVFREDFSDRTPVYDEDPLDLLPIPRAVCDLYTEGNPATSCINLSFDKEGAGEDQIEQLLRRKFMNCRRSKLNASGGMKRRTHYQLHHHKIRKQRKRRANPVHRRSSHQ